MISLYDYIFEAKSGNFSNKNFKSGSNGIEDYHYAIMVLNALFNNEKIQMVNATHLTLDMFDKDKLQTVKNNASKYIGTHEDFNNAFNPDNLSKIKIKDIKQVWNSILKSPFSGGSTPGGNAEIVVCNIFNKGNYSDEDIVNECDKHNVNSIWVKSIRNTINIINRKKWKHNDYFAVQVDGKSDFKNDVFDTNDITKIIAAYSNKNEIGKHFNINVSKLYPQSSKDAWNKADILLIKKDKDVIKRFDDMLKKLSEDTNKTDCSVEYNTILVSFVKSKEIIPISLKKVPDDDAKIYTHNLEDNEGIAFEDFGSGIELQIPSTKMNNDLKGSLYLGLTDDNETDTNTKYNSNVSPLVQFYTRASSVNNKNGNATAKIELKGKNSKGGSGFLNMCNYLGITTSEAYASEDEVKKGVEKFFNWDLKKLPNNLSENWYKKPCFTVLIGLLNKYCSKHNREQSIDVLYEFTLFAIGCCLGNGSYYIIK